MADRRTSIASSRNTCKPIGIRVLALVQEGVASGEFRPVDPNQFLPSAIGSIVHYFLTAPLREKFMPERHASTAQAIQQRRAAVLDFIAAALFTDRDAGIALAATIAAQPPARLIAAASAAPRTEDGQTSAAAVCRLITCAPARPQPPIQAMDTDTAVAQPDTQPDRRQLDTDGWTAGSRISETAARILQEEAEQRQGAGPTKAANHIRRGARSQVKPHKFFVFLLVLLGVAAGYYFYSTDRTSDTVLIGIVDANQVIVSSKIMGRVEKLYVDEGSKVKAGDLIAEIDSAELEAEKNAAQATINAYGSQVSSMRATASADFGRDQQRRRQRAGAAGIQQGYAGAGQG